MRWIALYVVAVAGAAWGQGTAAATAVKKAYFTEAYDPALSVTLEHLIARPAADESASAMAELAEMHRVETTRTPEEVKAAQYDDAHEDVFVYAGTITDAAGKTAAFSAEAMPLLAAFAVHLRADAGLVDGQLKGYFKRLRPYNFDKTSGHSINGYLYDYLLADVLPEESDRVLARAQGYARNRVVCRVHYASDTEASRRVVAVVFGYMLGLTKFAGELSAVRSEVRMKLGFAER